MRASFDLAGDPVGHMLLHPDGTLFGPFYDTLPLRETCWNLVLLAEDQRAAPFESAGPAGIQPRLSAGNEVLLETNDVQRGEKAR